MSQSLRWNSEWSGLLLVDYGLNNKLNTLVGEGQSWVVLGVTRSEEAYRLEKWYKLGVRYQMDDWVKIKDSHTLQLCLSELVLLGGQDCHSVVTGILQVDNRHFILQFIDGGFVSLRLLLVMSKHIQPCNMIKVTI